MVAFVDVVVCLAVVLLALAGVVAIVIVMVVVVVVVWRLAPRCRHLVFRWRGLVNLGQSGVGCN